MQQTMAATTQRGASWPMLGGGKMPAPGTGDRMQVGRLLVSGSLPRCLPRVPVFLLEKCLLDLVVDAQEPRLGARGTVAKMIGLGFELPHSLLGSSQLK